MRIKVDIGDSVSIYEQIVRQVREGVQRGVLTGGTSLPSIRQLAADLGVNHNTVARAYRDLEQDGIVVTARRRGTIVRSDAQVQADHSINRSAERKIKALVDELLGSGLDNSSIKRMFLDGLKRQGKTT